MPGKLPHGRPRGRPQRQGHGVPPHVLKRRRENGGRSWQDLSQADRDRLLANPPGAPRKPVECPDGYVIIDANRDVISRRYDCVSAAAADWEPSKTFIRAVEPDGRLRQLVEAERAEAQRVRDAA